MTSELMKQSGLSPKNRPMGKRWKGGHGQQVKSTVEDKKTRSSWLESVWQGISRFCQNIGNILDKGGPKDDWIIGYWWGQSCFIFEYMMTNKDRKRQHVKDDKAKREFIISSWYQKPLEESKCPPCHLNAPVLLWLSPLPAAFYDRLNLDNKPVGRH